jgi:hypothetical protein
VNGIGCQHGAGCHDGTLPSTASAPPSSRAWLLIEHPGPWPEQETDAIPAGPLRAMAGAADRLGLRVQLIRRPGRHRAPRAPALFAGWTAGRWPWLRRGDHSGADRLAADLARLSEGHVPAFGSPVARPLFLVCTHGRRDVCCARFGAPLARTLAGRHPGQVWETTHVGGHRYAANLVILPHGLYYGPVGEESARAAIAAYRRGELALDRYRGRAGQPRPVQAAEYARMTRTGPVSLSALT